MSEATTAASVPARRVHGAMPASAVRLLILINLLWAASSAPAKLVLGASAGAPGTIGPFGLGAARFGIAAILFLIAARVAHIPLRIQRADAGRFLFIGGFGIAVTYGVFYTGLRGSTATEASLLVSAEPVLIALMARVFLQERMTRVQSAGMAAGFAGVYVIVMQGLMPRWTGGVASNAVVAIAMGFEATASVMGKHLADRYPGLVVVAGEALIGALVLLPLGIAEAASTGCWAPAGPRIWGLLYLALVCSFFCYGVWFWLLPRTEVSSMAGFLFLQPVLGPVIGYVMLGERPGVWTLAGAAMVIAGVWLVAIAGPRRRSSRAT